MMTIRRINQNLCKKSLAPYNKPIDPKGPSIVDNKKGTVVIFDGWQTLPAQKLRTDVELDKALNFALESAFIRSINIQRQQIKNRITFYHPRLKETMIITDIVDPFVLREKEEKKARALARQTLMDIEVDQIEEIDD